MQCEQSSLMYNLIICVLTSQAVYSQTAALIILVLWFMHHGYWYMFINDHISYCGPQSRQVASSVELLNSHGATVKLPISALIVWFHDGSVLFYGLLSLITTDLPTHTTEGFGNAEWSQFGIYKK